MSSVNVNLHSLEHSHKSIQKLLSILAYKLIFFKFILHSYFSKYSTSNYLFYTKFN